MEQYIINKNTVTIEQLCEKFDVSKNTIRRDIDELVKRGHTIKVYGGVANTLTNKVVPSSVRNELGYACKDKIGRLAATCVNDNDTVYIDSGSTTIRAIKYLSEKRNITIISHSLPALCDAAQYPNLTIISIGGVYNNATSSFVGAGSISSVNNLSINVALMAATGVSIEKGLSNMTFFEAEIKSHVVKRSNRIVLMADKSKFGRDALVTYCPIGDVDTIVTEECEDEKYIRFCHENGVNLLTGNML
jgi:DeoR family myo-inositol catabolism operon transcriptional repressor